jgi:acetyl esterase/lipase
VVYLHSGGFVRNDPRSEEHLVVHLAVDTGVWVVCVDYGTAPTARYPQAEEQCYDATTWVADPAQGHPWDTSRMAVVGASAGGKLVLNVCQQLRDAGQPRPASAAVLVPVTDLTRSDRTSSHPRPIIDHRAQQLMLDVWIPERWRRNEPLASPRFDPELPTAMPPTLVQTAALDTLGPEGEELVSVLRAGGVDVRHHRFADLDHGFGATDPRAAREAIEEIGAFLHETLRLDDRSGGTP